MTLKELEEQKKLYAQAATAQKKAIEDQTNTAIKDLKAEQESIIKDYDAEYNDIVNIANVQKHVSRREISEAMANAGATDSGLNRTQQTAVQLSYANTENQARIGLQKFVDAIAAAVREKTHSFESSMKTNQANVDAEYAENITKLQDTYDTQGNKKYEASNKLIPTLNDVEKTTTEKLSLLSNYADQYGADKVLATYAKSYYNETANDANATQEAKDAAAQVYAKVAGAEAADVFVANGNYGAINTLLNTLDGDELNALFAKLDENGIEIDFATNTVKQKPQNKENVAPVVAETQTNEDTTESVAKNPYKETQMAIEEKTSKDKLKPIDEMLTKGYIDNLGIDEVYKRGEFAGLTKNEVDAYLTGKYGAFWPMYKALAYDKLPSEWGFSATGKGAGFNLVGLDANKEFNFNKYGLGMMTIGDIRSEAIKAGVKRSLMRSVLNEFGGLEI